MKITKITCEVKKENLAKAKRGTSYQTANQFFSDFILSVNDTDFTEFYTKPYQFKVKDENGNVIETEEKERLIISKAHRAALLFSLSEFMTVKTDGRAYRIESVDLNKLVLV